MNDNLKKNKTVIVVDGNNLLYRCYFKFSGMVSKKGEPSSIMFGYPYVLKSLIGKFKPVSVYNVFDGGRSPERLKILPDYKKREPKLGFDIDDFRKQKSLLMEYLPYFNTYVTQKRKQEADDLIYQLVRRLKKSYNVIIVSSDKDFIQMIDDNVICHNPSKGIEITRKNVKHRYGYNPEECVDWLILDGDKSDNIPGLSGMGKKRIREFLDTYSSIANYLNNNMQYKKLDNALLADVYKRNKYLIDLAYYYRKFNRKMKLTHIGKPDFNPLKIREIADRFDIFTFNKKDFLQTYKKLK